MKIAPSNNFDWDTNTESNPINKQSRNHRARINSQSSGDMFDIQEIRQKKEFSIFLRETARRPTNIVVKNATRLTRRQLGMYTIPETSGHKITDEIYECEEDLDNIFDSDDEESSKGRCRCVLDLEGDFKTIWDNAQIFFVLYVSIMLPLRFSFYPTAKYLIWNIADYVTDSYFVVDMVLTFFTPIYIEHKLIRNHLIIALNYFKFWFWLDLLSILPFEYFFISSDSSYSKALKFAKVPKLYKMFKIAKLLRTLKLRRKGNSLMGRLLRSFSSSDTIYFSILPFYLFGLIIAHIFSCVWHFLSFRDGNADSWLRRYGYDSSTPMEKYTASLYYVYSTITTTGYGDIVPLTQTEFIMTLIFMGAGVTFHSLIFSKIMEGLGQHKENALFFDKKKDLLKQLLKTTKIFEENKRMYHDMM